MVTATIILSSQHIQLSEYNYEYEYDQLFYHMYCDFSIYEKSDKKNKNLNYIAKKIKIR